jgi:hypothetical protein
MLHSGMVLNLSTTTSWLFFPLPADLPCRGHFFPLIKDSQCKKARQNALEALTDGAEHFAKFFIVSTMKSRFHSTKMKKSRPPLKN